MRVSRATVGRAISRLPGGWPIKKSKVAQEEREEEARGLWRWLAKHFDARRLVFVDESGMHTSMTRLYAQAHRGRRAYGKVARNRGKNTTLIAAICLEGGMGESVVIEGATDAEIFEILRPTWSTFWRLRSRLVRWRCLTDWGHTGHRGSEIAHRSHRRRRALLYLPSPTLAGFESHRGGFQQDQGYRA